MLFLAARVQPKTVSRKLAAVSSMYIELMRFEKIRNNPFSIIKRPKEKEHIIIHLTPKEKESFLYTVSTGVGLNDRQLIFHENTRVRDMALYSLFLDTGLRVSELVGIDLIDVDFEEHGIVVTRKGGKIMMVYFGDQTQNRLEEYIEERERQLAETTIDEPALFLNNRCGRLSIRSVQILTKQYIEAAAINKRISPHKLRSSFAMAFYEQTGDLLLLKDLMGHSSISTTTLYADATQERQKKARNWQNNK